jgi:hypothetical protein
VLFENVFYMEEGHEKLCPVKVETSKEEDEELLEV